MAMTEQQVQLVLAAQSGDVKSFEELYAIFHEKVYALARMMVKNSGDAEDILQETFITAWRKLSTLETAPTFSVWVQVIARNLCNMQLRRKNTVVLPDAEQEIENLDTNESEEVLPAIYTERMDLRVRLGSIIDSLSDVQRQAVTLYYFNELSVEEISGVMECSVNTVKTRLFLARKAIRSEIEEQEQKSGEKFFGVSGLPLLPFGKLIGSHIKSISIDQKAARATLDMVTNTILSSGGSDAAMAAAAAQNTITEGTKVAKKMSLTAKILAGVSAVAAVGAATLLGVIIVTGGIGKNNPPIDDDLPPTITEDVPPSTDSNDLDTLWNRLNGYWTGEENTDMFVGFFKESDVFDFEYGLYQTGYWLGGDITGADESGENTFTLTLHLPATPATEMNAAMPERTEAFYLDISDLDVGGTIKVQIAGFGNGGWYTFKHGGDTLEDAFDGSNTVYDYNDLSSAIADVPKKEALDEMYILLEGYWITTTSDYPFVGFSINENGTHEIEYGLFQTSWGLRGEIVDGYAMGAYEAALIIHIPAAPPNEMDDGYPESIQTIYIDIGGLYQDGTIRVKIEELFELDTDDGLKDNSVWFTYKPGGTTLEEAFENWWA